MLRCGLDLDGELLALAAASHSGEDFHVAGARRILAGAGLTEDALQCPPDLAMDEDAQRAMILAGARARPDPLQLLGQARGHAGHLRGGGLAHARPTGTRSTRCRWPSRRGYRELAGEPVAAIGVDGCGAPLLAISVTGLARAFRALVLAEPGTPERRVADAMRAYPAWTSGTHRPERQLMDGRARPAAQGRRRGRGRRSRWPTAGPAASRSRTAASGPDADHGGRCCASSASPGVPGADLAALAELATVPVTGGGRLVGEVRATLPVS